MRRRALEIRHVRNETQRGQAAVEYLVVTAVIVSALVAGGNASVINQFCAAFRSLYRAYSFALSLA
jgi:Flp pilus assembly pilin Flp